MAVLNSAYYEPFGVELHEGENGKFFWVAYLEYAGNRFDYMKSIDFDTAREAYVDGTLDITTANEAWFYLMQQVAGWEI